MTMASSRGDSPTASASAARTIPSRRTACLPCRQRKLKCDGNKPICSNCLKPKLRGLSPSEKRNPPKINCVWDAAAAASSSEGVSNDGASQAGEDGEVVGRKRPRPDDLEERVAFLEGLLASRLPDTLQSHAAPSLSNSSSQLFVDGQLVSPLYSVPSSRPEVEVASEDPFFGLGSLIHSGWPSELPSMDIVHHIMDVFFDKVPTVTKMLRQRAIQANLLFPPDHNLFPCPALLHAIIYITSSYLPSDAASKREYWPISTPSSAFSHPFTPDDQVTSLGRTQTSLPTSSSSALEHLQLWHRQYALKAFYAYADQGRQYLQLLQSIILIATADQLNARWTDMWSLAGTAMRLAIPMRLYESRLVPNRPSMTCPPAKDALQQAEMDRTWWMAFLLERTSSMWTTWPLQMADDEITCELPVLHTTFLHGQGELLGVQTFDDPALFTDHPPCHQDSLVLTIKVVKLFAAVQRFFRFYQRRAHSTDRYLEEPELRVLMSQANLLRLSLPLSLRKPTQPSSANGHIDRDLLSSTMMLHGVSIVLGEPLITATTRHHDVARSALVAIRAILSMLYDVIATSFDLTLLPASVSYVFLLAAKALLRFADAADQVNDKVSAKVYASEIEVFRMALRQYGQRFAIGLDHSKSLDDLLAERGRVINDRSEMVSTARIEDTIQPQQIPSAVGFMKIPLVAREMVTDTPSMQSSGTTPASARIDELSSIADSFTIPERDQQFTLNNDLFLLSDQARPLTNAELADISNYSFDPEDVFQLLGLTGAGSTG